MATEATTRLRRILTDDRIAKLEAPIGAAQADLDALKAGNAAPPFQKARQWLSSYASLVFATEKEVVVRGEGAYQVILS